MLKLKKLYPNRVHFILGNRDINKLRLYAELHPSSLKRAGQVYWIPKESAVNETKSDRLKWILNETMGAPLSFEYRRQELIELNKPYSDDDVAQSFIDFVSPTGKLTEYLSHGKIVHIDGDTIFVHGALRNYNIGWVAPCKRSESFAQIINNPHDWAYKINKFAQDEVNDYINNINLFVQDTENLATEKVFSWSAIGGYDHKQPGSRLMQYGMGWLKDKSVNRSVIYASYLGAATVSTPAPSRDVSPLRNTPSDNIIKTLEDDTNSNNHNNSDNRLPSTGMSSKNKLTPSSPPTITPSDKLLIPNSLPLPPLSEIMSTRNKQGNNDIDIEVVAFLTKPPNVTTTNMNTATASDSINSTPINKIIVGHIPRGDAPLILNNTGVQVIHGDTSYAANVIWDKNSTYSYGTKTQNIYNDNNDENSLHTEEIIQKKHGYLNFLPNHPIDSTRGQAVSEIILKQYNDDLLHRQVFIHGRLSNGFDYSMSLKNDDTNYIGRKVCL